MGRYGEIPITRAFVTPLPSLIRGSVGLGVRARVRACLRTLTLTLILTEP